VTVVGGFWLLNILSMLWLNLRMLGILLIISIISFEDRALFGVDVGFEKMDYINENKHAD